MSLLVGYRQNVQRRPTYSLLPSTKVVRQRRSLWAPASLWPVFVLGKKSWLLESYRNNYTHRGSRLFAFLQDMMWLRTGHGSPQGPGGQLSILIGSISQCLDISFGLFKLLPLEWIPADLGLEKHRDESPVSFAGRALLNPLVLSATQDQAILAPPGPEETVNDRTAELWALLWPLLHSGLRSSP